MMRLGWGTSLLIALYLLASAATASAECAWVLWAYTLGKSTSEHSVESAHTTKRECDATVRGYAESMKKKGYSVSGGFAGGEEVIGEKAGTTFKYFCLPDTVDPRGAKGK